MHLVLASASPRRAELLRAAGFTFETVVVDVDERARDSESPATYVRRLAAEKSTAALAQMNVGADPRVGPDAHTGTALQGSPIILGADTTVVVEGDILGKPIDDADAGRMLRRLSGRSHEVLTGISLRRGAHELGRVITTIVEFSPLTDGDISWYLASGEGRDKAGAYAIQGLASRFIPRIDGSYSNVVGLPLAAVHELLVDIASRSGSGYSDTRSFPRKSL